jgi:hypothetical protein
MESGVRNRTKNLLLFEIRKGEACPGLVRVGALAASLGGWRDGLLLAQLLKPGRYTQNPCSGHFERNGDLCAPG